ncbi:hypothetical protein [Kitasatospora sp. NPDC001547]|uniref:hypothetical protein n=1 Tax=Kitasatospora sp. NPDC001547 TaxID=3364015 RepID=UPI0036AF50A6
MPLHRYVHVPGGTHTDGSARIDKEDQPMLPSFVEAFDELEAWARPTTRSRRRLGSRRPGPFRPRGGDGPSP